MKLNIIRKESQGKKIIFRIQTNKRKKRIDISIRKNEFATYYLPSSSMLITEIGIYKKINISNRMNTGENIYVSNLRDYTRIIKCLYFNPVNDFNKFETYIWLKDEIKPL